MLESKGAEVFMRNFGASSAFFGSLDRAWQDGRGDVRNVSRIADTSNMQICRKAARSLCMTNMVLVMADSERARPRSMLMTPKDRDGQKLSRKGQRRGLKREDRVLWGPFGVKCN